MDTTTSPLPPLAMRPNREGEETMAFHHRHHHSGEGGCRDINVTVTAEATAEANMQVTPVRPIQACVLGGDRPLHHAEHSFLEDVSPIVVKMEWAQDCHSFWGHIFAISDFFY